MRTSNLACNLSFAQFIGKTRLAYGTDVLNNALFLIDTVAGKSVKVIQFPVRTASSPFYHLLCFAMHQLRDKLWLWCIVRLLCICNSTEAHHFPLRVKLLSYQRA